MLSQEEREKLQQVRETVNGVCSLVEDTYPHDEAGERVDGDSPLSGADVVEVLMGMENGLREASLILQELLGPPEPVGTNQKLPEAVSRTLLANLVPGAQAAHTDAQVALQRDQDLNFHGGWIVITWRDTGGLDVKVSEGPEDAYRLAATQILLWYSMYGPDVVRDEACAMIARAEYRAVYDRYQALTVADRNRVVAIKVLQVLFTD